MRLTDNNHSLIQRDEHDKIDPKFGPNHILSLLLSNLVLDDESIRIVLCGCPNTGVDNAYFSISNPRYSRRGSLLIVHAIPTLRLVTSPVAREYARRKPVPRISVPVQHDLAAIASMHDFETFVEVLVVEAMGDDLADVQTRLQHDRHLVPGFIHLTAVDALNG